MDARDDRYYRPRHAPRVVVGRTFDTFHDPFRQRIPQSFDEALRVVVARRFDRQSFDEILQEIVAPFARLDEIVDLTFRQRSIVDVVRLTVITVIILWRTTRDETIFGTRKVGKE